MKILIYTLMDEDLSSKLKKYYLEDTIIQTKDKEKALEEIVDTDILILNCKAEDIIKKGIKLKLIHTLSSGVDYLPLELIKERKIPLCNTAGLHSGHMSEYVISSMILLSRNLHIAMRNQVKHTWNQRLSQHEIAGATIAILGLGKIGREVARKSSFMGMKVIGINSTGKKLENVDEIYTLNELDKVLIQSDYVVNLLPLTKETKNIVNENFFKQMKETACLINIGRGQTTDQEALYNALKNKEIRAAMSDVFAMEPIKEDSLLWDLENLVITPHICGFIDHYMDKAIKIIKPNLDIIQTNEGKLVNQVDLIKGY